MVFGRQDSQASSLARSARRSTYYREACVWPLVGSLKIDWRHLLIDQGFRQSYDPLPQGAV